MGEVKKADLHMHSYYSDGDHSPAELVRMAKDAGLSCIALTDHDRLEGNAEAAAAGAKYGIEFIPGVELKTAEGEILGLWIDTENKELKALCDLAWKRREGAMLELIKMLKADGYEVSYDEERAKYPKGIPMIAHIVELCVQKGYFKSFKEAYDDFFADGCKYDIQSEKIMPEEAIRVIKNAGGIAIFAHPWLEGTEYFFEHFDELVELGLDGVEVECSLFKPPNYEQVAAKAIELCEAKGLVMTRGGDFHKDGVGAPLGEISVEYPVVDELKKRLNKK